LLLYALGRRTGAPVWVAVIGAAAVLLSLDQIVLEHIILSEALFVFLFVATLYVCVRALDDPRPLAWILDTRHAWLIGAGLLLAMCAWVRGVAAPLAPFLLLWILLAVPGTWRRRFANAVVAGIAIAALMLTYFALNDMRTGTFGLSQSTGWGLYSRVAPLADCSQFTPPAGTESLCEQTPPGTRNGPDFYGWEPGSPAVQLYTYPPTGDDKLGAFARESIRAQRRMDGPVEALSEVQDWVRVQPLLMLAAMVLGIAGIVFTRGRVRAVLILLCGGGLLLFFVPSATANYNARYAIPSSGPIVLAGAIAAWALLGRWREWRSGTSGRAA
jgi:hypothetical protein